MNDPRLFTPLTEEHVSSLENLSSLEGQGQAFNQYYNPQRYKNLAGQTRYQSLVTAEATGGLGSASTNNRLATIAPTFGQQRLSGQMNDYQNLANISLSAFQGQINAGQTYANSMSQISQQSAALAATNANGPPATQFTIGGGASGVTAGTGLVKLTGSSTPWGTAISGGPGLLDSLLQEVIIATWQWGTNSGDFLADIGTQNENAPRTSDVSATLGLIRENSELVRSGANNIGLTASRGLTGAADIYNQEQRRKAINAFNKVYADAWASGDPSGLPKFAQENPTFVAQAQQTFFDLNEQ